MPRPQPIDEPSAGPRGDAEAGGVPEAVVLGMLRLMRLSRHLDEQMMRRQRQGKVGFYGAITGQEAVPAAAAFASRPTDWVFPALRECAILLGRGFPLATYLAQVYGSAADVNKGRQMPSHMSSRAVNVVSWSSCIGPQLPQAVGMAMAARRAGNDDIALAFLGDGATSTASFHAAMTFAGVYRAPVVFVCQNNHWAISVPAHRQTAAPDFAVKGRGYGVPSARVDGNDALALFAALRDALERARGGAGPTFIEAVTYRIGAHSSSDDPSRYRSAEEVERWRARDPIARLERHMRERGLFDDDASAAMDAEIAAEVREAIAQAERVGPPPVDSLVEDVYAAVPPHLEAQRDALRARRPHPAGVDRRHPPSRRR